MIITLLFDLIEGEDKYLRSVARHTDIKYDPSLPTSCVLSSSQKTTNNDPFYDTSITSDC